MKKKLLYLLGMIALAQPTIIISQGPFKKMESIISGSVLALAGNALCEYVTVLSHELGHSVTQKMFTGDRINVEVKAFKPLNPLTPFNGVSRYITPLRNRMKDIIVTAAGPLAGIAAIQLQLQLLNMCDKNEDTTVFHYLKRLYEGSKSANFYEPESRSGVALALLKFLRCGSMIGQTAYGFLPVDLEFSCGSGVTDGQRIWANILKRNKTNAPCISNKLYTGTAACMLLPSIAGLCVRFLKR